MSFQINPTEGRFINSQVLSTIDSVTSVFTSIPEEVLQYINLQDLGNFSLASKGFCRAADQEVIARAMIGMLEYPEQCSRYEYLAEINKNL